MSRDEQTPASDGVNTFFSHSAISSVPWTIVNKCVTFFIYFAVAGLLFRKLGKDQYGIYAFSRSLCENLQIICALGLNTALVRFIPELYATRNRAGIVRLVSKAAAMQVGMACVVICIAYILAPIVAPYFARESVPNFRWILVLTAVLAGALMGKDFVYDIFTAMFQVRIVSMLSILQAALWLFITATALYYSQTVAAGLLAQISSLALTIVPGVIMIRRLFNGLVWQSPPQGIGKRRTLNTSFSSMLSSIGNMVLQRYSEVYFLGFFHGAAMMGLYENACALPFMTITFLPLAMQKLFTAGLAEAYTADPTCLGRLVSGLFKALILLIMPVSAFGVFFAPDMARFIYGPGMEPALLLTSLFFFFHVLPLISVPLSMAIVTKEKILHMTPTTLFQIVVNLLLDYFLIKHYALYGAIAAVFLTFVITIPLRLYMVYRLVGGIFFPTWFFFKISAILFLIAGAMSILVGHLNIFALAAVAATYGLCYVLALRYLRLVSPEDVADLRAMGYAKLNRALDFISGEAHA